MPTQSREGRQAGADSRFADALRPLVETALQRSLHEEPEFWAHQLCPFLLPAVRKAVAAAIHDMVEVLDQVLENSLSSRMWRWRYEAWRTGKPLGEIVLLHTLVYRVEQVLLVHRASGLLLASASAPGITTADSDLVSAMLTAIQEFVRDSFHLEQDDAIRQIHTGDFSLWVEPGPLACIAAAVRGTAPVEFRQVLRAATDLIHDEMGAELRDFQGDSQAIEARALPILEGCLQSRWQPRRSGGFWRVWVLLGLAVGALILWSGIAVWHAIEWHRALAALEATPGITVTGTAQEHGHYVLEGLRDPMSASAENVLARNGISPREVEVHFQPFLSLDPRIVMVRVRAALDAPDTVAIAVDHRTVRCSGAASHAWILQARQASPKLAMLGIDQLITDQVEDRDLQGLRSAIEGVRILFDQGSGIIGPAQAGPVKAVVPKLRQWIEDAIAIGRTPRLAIVGHADRTGSDIANAYLSNQRGRHVRDALVAAGIPSGVLTATGEGAGEGGEESAGVVSALHRNVVFRCSTSAESAAGERR